MPQQYTVTIGGHAYDVDSEESLSDEQAYQYALSQHRAAPPTPPARRLPAGDGTPEPDTFWGGFMRHLIEKEPATVGALGGLGVMGAGAVGAPAAAVTAATAAMPTLANAAARVSRWMRGAPQEALGAGEVTEDVLGAALPFAGPAMGRVASKVATSPLAQKAIGAVTGHAVGGAVGHPWIGGAAGAKYGAPVVKAGAEALAPLADATPGNVSTRLGASIRALLGSADEEAAPVVDQFMPNRSGVRMSREVPGYSMPESAPKPDGWFVPKPAPVEPDLPLPMSSEAETLASLDRYMPNSGAEAMDLSERNAASLTRGRTPYREPDFGSGYPEPKSSMLQRADQGLIDTRAAARNGDPMARWLMPDDAAMSQPSASLKSYFDPMASTPEPMMTTAGGDASADIVGDVTSALKNLGYRTTDASHAARLAAAARQAGGGAEFEPTFKAALASLSRR